MGKPYSVCTMLTPACLTTFCFCSCRCPNPQACKHNIPVSELAWQHPYNTSVQNPNWTIYTQQQCSGKDGYDGLLCGVCTAGYGMTTPFTCKKCLTSSPDTTTPHLAGISGLYVFFWVVLTAWYVFTVWIALPATTSNATSQQESLIETGSQVLASEDKVVEVVIIDCTGDGFTEQAATKPATEQVESETSLLDIVKVSNTTGPG